MPEETPTFQGFFGATGWLSVDGVKVGGMGF